VGRWRRSAPTSKTSSARGSTTTSTSATVAAAGGASYPASRSKVFFLCHRRNGIVSYNGERES